MPRLAPYLREYRAGLPWGNVWGISVLSSTSMYQIVSLRIIASMNIDVHGRTQWEVRVLSPRPLPLPDQFAVGAASCSR